jgi:hemerythrin-like domain-containing protein
LTGSWTIGTYYSTEVPVPSILGQNPDHGFDEPLGLLTDCHRRIERFLEVLRPVVHEYAERPLDTRAESAVLTAKRYFADAAPRHTADEEDSLFPRLRSAAAARSRPCDAIARLEGEHDRADRLHARADELLEAWLRDLALPARDHAELGSLLDTLRELYRAHIHTEEAEVFPLAAELLSGPDLAAMGSEMRARRGLAPEPERS